MCSTVDNSHTEWKPITLTLVEFPKGDNLGYMLAWISLTPVVLGFGFITLILFRRDLHTISYFTGVLFNEIINRFFKYLIQEPRPFTKANSHGEYGMPSSHSQFISFFSSYAVLFMIIRQKNAFQTPLDKIVRVLTVLLLVLFTVLVPYSRVYLCYHTFFQVTVGLVVGLFNGIVWFIVTQLFLSPMYPYIVSWKISEFLLLRDTTLIPNILWFEYAVIRQEARVRSRKVKNKKMS